MAGVKINVFSGLRPRMPESLLPEGAATLAENCDFAYGELRNTKAGFLVGTMSNSPKSVYTDDGLSFYTWTVDVNAVRSPLAKDTYNRLYYTGDGGPKVADRTGVGLAGGPPASSYLVGVLRPTVAPVLAASAVRTVDATTCTLAFRFHWEYGGVRYQEQAIAPTALGQNRYQFTPSARVAGTPDQAYVVLRMTATWLSDGTQVFDLYSTNSALDDSQVAYTLSLSQDSGASTYTATMKADIDDPATQETRAYVYTYVNTYGEEGPPSPPSKITASLLQDIGVTVTRDAIGSYAPIKEIRVYRTPTGSTMADYFYVGSIQVLGQVGTTFAFTDNVDEALLDETLASTNDYPPPVDLVGLMALPNGILCGWRGNELWFSEAYRPWAWPPAYVKPLPHAIVGGIEHGSGAVITTTGKPYLVSGVSPDAMTTAKLNVDQAGVSKWSIAVVDGACMYASHDGLVVLNGGSASLMASQRFFTREVWRQRVGAGLSGMRFSVWDGRLIVFHATGAFTPFMIRMDEADGTMTDLPGFTAACAFVSQLSDQCYYANGTGLYQFNGGAGQTAVWQSREVVLPRPSNFGAGQALVTGAWTLEFYADGVLRLTQALAAGTTDFRLPGGFLAERWKIKASGSGRFRELRIATTGRELAAL